MEGSKNAKSFHDAWENSDLMETNNSRNKSIFVY